MNIYRLLQENTVHIIENIAINYNAWTKKATKQNIFTWRRIIIKDYRAHKSNEFKTELGSSAHYVFKTKEQTILEAIIGAFEGENM